MVMQQLSQKNDAINLLSKKESVYLLFLCASCCCLEQNIVSHFIVPEIKYAVGLFTTLIAHTREFYFIKLSNQCSFK